MEDQVGLQLDLLTSKGGLPVNSVYSMHPKDHTSDSRPWGPRLATSLYRKEWQGALLNRSRNQAFGWCELADCTL